MMDRTNQTITLRDGRTLGYAEYGDPEGKPVFYFHGFPLSRLDWPLCDHEGITSELGIRIIAIDRPGTGLSTFKRHRQILDWPDDVVELADALGIERFGVLGISGGGPYAASCAYKVPERLTSTTIVAGMCPADAPGVEDGHGMRLARKNPLMRRIMLFISTMGIRKAPARVLLALECPEADSEFISRPENLKVMADAFLEASRSGNKGSSWCGELYTRPWGFRLEDIPGKVHLWHGEADLNVPVSAGRYMAEAIPECQATFIPDEGHMSITGNNLRDIMAGMVS